MIRKRVGEIAWGSSFETGEYDMKTIFSIVRKLRNDTNGATAIEYGLIAALLGTALVTAMNGMGNSLKTTFNTTSSQMSTANAGA